MHVASPSHISAFSTVCIGNLVIELSYLVVLRWAAHAFRTSCSIAWQLMANSFGTNSADMGQWRGGGQRAEGGIQPNGPRYGKYVNNLLLGEGGTKF